MTYHDAWTKIGKSIDDINREIGAVKATQAKRESLRKPWPAYAIKEMSRQMASFPDADLFHSRDHLF